MIDHDHFYVTLFSSSSQKLYKSNTLTRFTINLAQPIELAADEMWEVGLCEIYLPFPREKPSGQQHAFAYIDIAPQYVGDMTVRCIRTFVLPWTGTQYYNPVQYLPVEKYRFQTIEVAILTMRGVQLALDSSSKHTKLVLHFRRRRVSTHIN